MENAVIILRQTGIMFLYMVVGFMLFRRNLITKEGSKSLAHLLLYVILPCVIIRSFLIEKNAENVQMILWSFAGAILVLAIAMAVAFLFFRKRPVDQFGASFSNAGFMGIPLITASLGEHAVVYAAAMIALLNILQWTYGQWLLSGDKKEIQMKKVLLNPLVVALLLGLLLFATQVQLPGIITGCMGSISQLNGPVAMIILGVYLGELKIRDIFCDRRVWLCSFVRLVVTGVLTMAAVDFLFSSRRELGEALLICSIAPVGSNVAVYAQKLNGDYKYAVKTVCLSTLLSVLTMPVIIYFFETKL